jgi:dGTPase
MPHKHSLGLEVYMGRNVFEPVCAKETDAKWEVLIRREKQLYSRKNDIRSDFARDYDRILHSTAYRRLKHKTQVFFATRNDHVCTRIEHVSHVASVSNTIAKYLGLNTELTEAIAIGHDVGHAPFGHQGETVLKTIAEKRIGEHFSHEKNSLRFVDKLELLPSPDEIVRTLNLTYAVRDGIICHCGEADDESLRPREEDIDLAQIEKPNGEPPFTWEGCVVKIADKIAYLGRDIEDALTLGLVATGEPLKERRLLLLKAKELIPEMQSETLNTTVLMNRLITNLCDVSNPDVGIRLSPGCLEFLKLVKAYNYQYIYKNKKLDYFKKYAELIINSIFDRLFECYSGPNTLDVVLKEIDHSTLGKTFGKWLLVYSDTKFKDELIERYDLDFEPKKFEVEKIYTLDDEQSYCRAIIDCISGMTDSFAIKIFNELTAF